jgi:flagellin
MAVTRINNNISALNAIRALNTTGEDLRVSLERLSSGLRINRASDDASGLAVAEKLRTQINGLNQAVDNAANAINLINTAEGALNETTARLQRIRSLTVQAANTGTNDAQALEAIQNEIEVNIAEITRIGTDTQFSTVRLLNGDIANNAAIVGNDRVGVSVNNSPVNSTLSTGQHFLQIERTVTGSETRSNGLDGVNNSGASGFVGTTFATGDYDLVVSNVHTGEAQVVSNAGSISDGVGTIADGTTLLVGQTIDNGVGGTVVLAVGDALTFNFTRGDGTTGTSTYTLVAGSDANAVAAQLGTDLGAGYTVAYDNTSGQFMVSQANSGTSSLSLTLDVDAVSTGAGVDLTAGNVIRTTGTDDTAVVSIDGGPGVSVTAGQTVTLFGQEPSDPQEIRGQLTLTLGANLTAGTDVLSIVQQVYEGTLDDGSTVEFRNGQEQVRFRSANGESIQLDMEAFLDLGLDNKRTITLSAVNHSIFFPIGANAGQEVRIALADMRAENLGFQGEIQPNGSARLVSQIDVTTLTGANEALAILDEGLRQVGTQRTALGAFTNRLETTIASLGVASENLTAAESRIRDADLAFETTRLARDQILFQAGISVLSQANLAPQNVLALLQK